MSAAPAAIDSDRGEAFLNDAFTRNRTDFESTVKEIQTTVAESDELLELFDDAMYIFTTGTGLASGHAMSSNSRWNSSLRKNRRISGLSQRASTPERVSHDL